MSKMPTSKTQPLAIEDFIKNPSVRKLHSFLHPSVKADDSGVESGEESEVKRIIDIKIREFSLKTYLDSLFTTKSKTSSKPFDPKQTEEVIRYLSINGAKVNYKFTKPAETSLLQHALDGILSTDGNETVDPKRLCAALSLIKNGANFSLTPDQKTLFVKAIIKSDAPWEIDLLFRKGFIGTSFQIDGVNLIEYAKSKVQNTEHIPNLTNKFVEFLATKESEADEIAAAKRKYLASPLTIAGNVAKQAAAEAMRAQMTDGGTTKKDNATFLAITEDGREKTFLEKKSNSVEAKFGADLFRIVSRKRYAAKRELLAKDKSTGEIYSAIKWDSTLAGNDFLLYPEDGDGLFSKETRDDKKFVGDYGYMCGVLQVFGEPDWSPLNFLRSAKTGKPVQIDANHFVNNVDGMNNYYKEVDTGKSATLKPNQRLPIYGSAQSFDFLRTHLVAPEDRLYLTLEQLNDIDINRQVVRSFPDRANYQNEDSYRKDLAASFESDFNDKIDTDLLDAIKRNIEKPGNEHLKADFMEFMFGIQSAIDLAQDKEFLAAYTEKYRAELGDKAFALASHCSDIFQSNAASAQHHFAPFLEYYRELSSVKAISAVVSTTLPEKKINEPEEPLLDKIRSGKIQTAEEISLALNASDEQEVTEEKMLEIFRELIINCEPEVAEEFYMLAKIHYPNFANQALVAPISLFSNPELETKSINVAIFLTEQGCKISETFLDGNAALSYCKNPSKRIKFLESLFLENPILTEQNLALFKAVNENDVTAVEKHLERLKTENINFTTLVNENGHTLIDSALLSLDRPRTLAVLLDELEQNTPDPQHKLTDTTIFEMSPTTSAASSNLIGSVNLMLKRGYYDLANIALYQADGADKRYSLLDNEAGAILIATHKLCKLLTSETPLTLKRFRGLAKANLAATQKYHFYPKDKKKEEISLFEMYFNQTLKAKPTPDEATVGEIVKSFKDAGIDLNAKSGFSEQSFIEKAYDAKNNSLILALIANGAEPLKELPKREEVQAQEPIAVAKSQVPLPIAKSLMEQIKAAKERALALLKKINQASQPSIDPNSPSATRVLGPSSTRVK